MFDAVEQDPGAEYNFMRYTPIHVCIKDLHPARANDDS